MNIMPVEVMSPLYFYRQHSLKKEDEAYDITMLSEILHRIVWYKLTDVSEVRTAPPPSQRQYFSFKMNIILVYFKF
jgi:hypothetical protein